MPVFGIVLLSLLGAALLGVGVTCAVVASEFPLELGDSSVNWADESTYEPTCYQYGWGVPNCDDVDDDWSDDVDDGFDGVDSVDGLDSADGWVEDFYCSVQPSELDFGLVAVGESVTREFTLSCTSPVDVRSVDFVASPEYPDSVVDVSTVVVGTVPEVLGDTVIIVSVTWTPGAPSVANPFGHLRIQYTDEVYDRYGYDPEFEVVDLRGRTPAPELVFSETSLDLGGIRPGESISQTLMVSNDGDAALDVSSVAIDAADSGATDSNWALTWEHDGAIEPGQSAALTVTFTHPSPGQPVGLSGRVVVITSNDPRGHSEHLPVRGYFWSKERCALSVVGPVSFPGSAIPSRGLVPVDVTLKNDGDGPCASVTSALVAGPATREELSLPTACDEVGAVALDVVDSSPSASLAPGEAVTLSTLFRAPNTAGTVMMPVGVIGLARDPGMPTFNLPVELQAAASPDGLCSTAVTITSPASEVVSPGGTWALRVPPEGCATRHAARIGGAGAICSATLSAGCADAFTLTTELSGPGDPACESEGTPVDSGLAVELAALGPPPAPSCSLELTLAGTPPIMTSTSIALDGPAVPESFVAANGTAVLFLGVPAAAATSGLTAYPAIFLDALPGNARVAFGDPSGGFVLHTAASGGPVVTASTLGSYEALMALAESWLAELDGDMPTEERLERALGATAWLVPSAPIEPGFGCATNAHCPPPLVCHGAPGETTRPCAGPAAPLTAELGTTVHVVWLGDPGESTDADAALDRWQDGGVLMRHHLVVHRVAGSVGACAPPEAPSGLVDALRIETGGLTVDACDGASAWQALGAAIADERGAYRLRYPAVPNTVFRPGQSLLCSTQKWAVSPSGRTVRPPPEPDCYAPPGSKLEVEYDALCAP